MKIIILALLSGCFIGWYLLFRYSVVSTEQSKTDINKQLNRKKLSIIILFYFILFSSDYGLHLRKITKSEHI